MSVVVVAGASGYLGRYLVVELARRAHAVRAIVRSRARAEQPGPFGSPSLADAVSEWFEGQITDPGFVHGVCDGADRVVSALGVTRQNASPWDVDYLANLRLLEDAERAAVRSFLYVNVMHVDLGTSLILRSKAAFTAALERSKVAHQIINPSGYFSDIGEYLAMARRGVALLPPAAHIRIAPIHGADLARFCADKMSDSSGAWNVGGPDVVTYPELADLAFRALGRKPRTITVPAAMVRGAVWAASRLGDRPRDLATFFADGLTHDAIGERYGGHHIADYFTELAAAP
jgi:uncharacterized protein YbjT (DUF2867 family)